MAMMGRYASLLTAVAVLLGCSDTRPVTSQIPVAPSAPPAQPPNTYVVSGNVLTTVDGVANPLAGRTVWFWVQQQISPTSGRGWSQSATADANGRYVAYVPDSRIFVSAWNRGRGEVQPCLASTEVRGDTNIDVHVVPADGPSGSNLPSAARPVVTGTVYELTPQGRRPVPRANLWLDASIDAYVGYTESDDAGRFVFCRVNAPVRMDIYRDGYQSAWRALAGIGDTTLDIELTRQ